MMKKCFLRVLCATAALLLALSALPALGQSYKTGYVIDNTMPVYQMPHRLSKTLGVMAYGQSVKVVAWQNGWAKVKNGDSEVGYCDLSSLSPNNPNTLNRDAYVKEGGTYVHSRPGTGYKRIATVSAGERLTAVAMTRDEKWVRVFSGKRYGYVQSSALSTTPVGRMALQGEKIWIVGNSAQIPTADYQGKGQKLSRVSLGQSYELLGTEGKRACLRNSSGKIGWVPTSCISKTNPNTLQITMYARSTGNFLHTNIDAGAGKRINKGAAVTVVAITPNGNWSRVQKDGKYYYMESRDLSVIRL